MTEIIIRAYSKINPYLEIIAKRKDGYHDLNTSFLSIGIDDKLKLKRINKQRIIGPKTKRIPQKENLCFKAAQLMKRQSSTKKGIKIELQKNIPLGAGLGGGSSDAASTIAGLNELWECNLSHEEMINIAKKIGADVPFFLGGGYCKAKGIGGELEQLKNKFIDRPILLIKPPFELSTPQVYKRYDELEETEKRTENFNHKRHPLKIKNDLERAALSLKPELKSYLEAVGNLSNLESFGLSGSGSGIFCIFNNEKPKEKKIQDKLKMELGKDNQFLFTTVTDSGYKIIDRK